jgi:hypothetical protein
MRGKLAAETIDGFEPGVAQPTKITGATRRTCRSIGFSDE